MTAPPTNITLHEVARRFHALDDFVICGHVSPDGDCLGSQLTLAHALHGLGKKAVCILCKDEPVDPSLLFLPGIEDMVAAGRLPGSPQAFVAVDAPTHERLGAAAAAIQARAEASFTIDHHPVDEAMADYSYVDPDSASTSMIVWELVKEMGVAPTRDMALGAYTGLASDTGCFQYQNTDAAAFDAAAEMLRAGADPAAVAAALYQSRRLPSLLLEGALLSRLRIDERRRWAMSYLTLEDFRALDACKADAEPLVSTLRSLEGVRVACLLREGSEGVRGNLRAKDGTDVARIARHLGGGGHRAAAGFTVPGPIEAALTQVAAALEAFVGEG
ncbi:MAG: DHH family phosphoesterase [Eggerthellaceae bacterium]|nr:DHH family phosphoesterase [Eggerthellaceae bacterium]